LARNTIDADIELKTISTVLICALVMTLAEEVAMVIAIAATSVGFIPLVDR